MKKSSSNRAASIRARLLNLARDRKEDFQLVLVRYANERLLFRLSRSQHASNFVLKGAALFTVWMEAPHRPTRDLDFLGFGTDDAVRIQSVFGDVIAIEFPDDGIEFLRDSLRVEPIREDQEYGGKRVTLRATLAGAQIALQVDVGFGDAITPKAETVEFPTLLDLPPPSLRVYPKETVVAEKLEALVTLGMGNSRMKDFFDLAFLSRIFEFDGLLLSQAVVATFARRGTPIPDAAPVALTPAFSTDSSKMTQWKAFLAKGGLEAAALDETMATIARFLMPVIDQARSKSTIHRSWRSGAWYEPTSSG